MRVLLADDEARVRSALKLLLEQQPDICVVGEADDGTRLMEEVRATQPDAVLMDWELPGLPAGELVPALHSADPALVIVALSSRPEARQAALLAGANCFISKVEPPEHVLAALNHSTQQVRR